jgi:flagellin
MGMVVRTNMAAINANNSLAQASKAQQNGMQKLASGFKINKAADDASGLAISEKMKNQIKALDTAKDNCEDGANMIQTAEGYMNETHDILNRMTELAEKSANGTLGDEDRNALQDEMDQLCGEIDRIATTANFNGHKLLDGSIGSKAEVKVESTTDGFKYKAPVDATKADRTNVIDGGKVTSSYSFAPGEDSAKFKINTITAGTAGSPTSFTFTANELGADGTASTTATNFTVNVKKGDTVTLDNSGGGTTSNGLKMSGATASKNATLTFNGTNWINDAGVNADVTGLKIDGFSKAAANTVFTFEKESSTAAAAKEGINLQIGESSTSADRLTVSINSFHTDSLFGGLGGLVNKSNDSDNQAATAAVKINKSSGNGEGNLSSTYKDAVSIDITDKDSASAAADAIRQISSYVSDERGKLGAQQNRLEHTVNNLTTASENTQAANSRIRDTDMAKEMMAYTSKNVIAQAAQSMLAQANSQPQNVLSLLQ